MAPMIMSHGDSSLPKLKYLGEKLMNICTAFHSRGKILVNFLTTRKL